MVDECMPVAKPKDDIKIIDVSCGSGIFLVAAFKRIVQWWQREQYKNTGEIKQPNIRKLKSILQSSIYGVDLEPEAVKLAIFSLTVALCDMLEPKKAWDELTEEKLIDLSENIVAKDFFDFIKTDEKFDLIIGNPPFNLHLKKKEEKEHYWQELSAKIKFDFEIPDNNIALAFLQQAMKLLKEGELLSLVIPSGPLLYNKTLGYRRAFLSKYNVPQIFDFSSLSGVLFEGRNYPVAVIFAQNTPPNDNDILHVAVRRSKTAKEKLYFEIDKYDLYYVPKELATTEQLIWKANLLGSGHLYHLQKRLQNLRTLEKYLKEKKKNHGWFYGEGYQSLVDSTTKPKPAPYLTGKRVIPKEKFTEDHIRMSDTEIEESKLFHRPREKNKKIFQCPHILIKKNLSLYIAFDEKDLIFRHDIIGVYAPEAQRSELIKFRSNLISSRSLYQALLLSWSEQAGISRSPKIVLTEDIMALPYPDDADAKKLNLSKAEKIICEDILNYSIDQLSQGEEAKVNCEDANKYTITAFAKTFCTSLNSIYKEKGKEFYPLEHIESISFICLPIAYGDPNKSKEISKTQREKIEAGDLSSLLDNPQEEGNILYKRIIKLYHRKDMVFLIKPKILRYWLKSIALRDANEVFNDLVNSGY
jgi:methylase of polypeptide subunit release factors